MERLLPSKAKVMLLFDAKPLPLTATLLPTLPADELRLTDGLPVLVAEAEDGAEVEIVERAKAEAV
ncbi:MAG TPA: hypothetical protein VK898_14380 [Chloroflexota bacterium]|nr:hypothetical protein [Chloroflexota bacterium]